MKSRMVIALLALSRTGCDAVVDPVILQDDRISDGGADGPQWSGDAGSPFEAYEDVVREEIGLVAYYRFSETERPDPPRLLDSAGGLDLDLDTASDPNVTGAIVGDPQNSALSVDGFAGLHPQRALDARLVLSRALTLELWLKPRGQVVGGQCSQSEEHGTKLVWVSGTEAPGEGAYGLELDQGSLPSLAFHIQFDPDGPGDAPIEVLKARTVGGVLTRGTVERDCADARWHHIVATYDAELESGNMKIYVDGRLAAANGEDHPRAARPSHVEGGIAGYDQLRGLAVGGAFDGPLDEPGSMALDGTIDEVAIYRVALSAERIRRHYRVGTRLQPSPN